MPAQISVIVRTLGRDTLARALASVDAQARDDVVVVLVDARGEAPLPASARTPLQRVHAGRRLQRTEAAQAGLDAVATRWALFLDDDDELGAGHLDKLAQALQDHPEAWMAHTGVALRNGQGEPVGVLERDVAPWELLLGNQLPIHAVLFDVQRLRAAGVAFDPTLPVYEDWDFWLQVLAAGPAVHVPGCSAVYHLAGAGSEVHTLAQGDAAHWRVWSKWWARAPQAWWTEVLREGQAASTLRLHLAHARDEVGVVERHLEQTREAVEALRAGLAGAQAQIDGHLQALQALQATEVELRHRLWAAEAERDRQAWRADAAEAQRDGAQAALATLQGVADERLEALLKVRQATQHLHATLHAETYERQKLAEALRAMQASTSWRVTAPLRRAAGLLHRWRSQAGAWRRRARWRHVLSGDDGYARWQREVEQVRWPASAAAVRASPAPASQDPSGTPRFSVVIPVCEPDLGLLDAALDSAAGLAPAEWEVCVADDASARVDVAAHLQARAARDPRLRWALRPQRGHIAACTNTALALARGEWVLFLDQDDLLAPHCGVALQEALQGHPDAQLLFSDEDKLDAAGRRFEPHFKPPFSLEALRAQNGISHLTAVRRERLVALGGLREGYDGAQDHELLLRLAEQVPAAQWVHVPAVLYHWRAAEGSTAADGGAKGYAQAAALRAVADHLQRTAPEATAEPMAGTPWLRVRHALPRPVPEVAVIGGADSDWSGLPVHVGDDGRSPWLLHLGPGVRAASPRALEELLALAAQPEVGAVAGTVFEGGRLAAGALEPDRDGGLAVWAQGVPRGHPGPFGRACIARDATAVDASALLVRRDLWPIWIRLAGGDPAAQALQFGQALRAAGLRLLWTPWAEFERAAAG